MLQPDGPESRCDYEVTTFSFERMGKSKSRKSVELDARAGDLSGDLDVRLPLRKLNSVPSCLAPL